MKSNSNIDELLCSFIDGELPARQKTEVQRMAARDPQVSQRLRQLRNCRNLVSALPRAEAPDDMIEQIRLSLERRTLLGERPVASHGRAGAWHLRIRHVTAAAAMIALLGVLGVVVYQIVSPVAPTETPGTVASMENPTAPVAPVSPPVILTSDSGFSGRLELRTAAMTRAVSFVNRAIEENGLTEMVESESAGGNSVYRLTCSREALGRLVADLNELWRNSESATLVVESGGFGESVVLETATLQQTAKIVRQDSTKACVEVARLENLAQEMPGRSIVAAAGEGLDALVASPVLPRPAMTAGNSPVTTISPEAEGTVRTTLTIVLIDARP